MRLRHKLLRLSRREWRDLAAAELALLRAEWRLRTRPKGGLVDRWSAGREVVAADRSRLPRAAAIGDAVRRVALVGFPRSQCLARSLAICELLEREGIDGAIIRIGVRPQDATLAAHAWVEFGGEIVGDSRAHVRAFQLLATARGGAEH